MTRKICEPLSVGDKSASREHPSPAVYVKQLCMKATTSTFTWWQPKESQSVVDFHHSGEENVQKKENVCLNC